ncbi:MAG: TetR/AcrR family transcriptional regulator [Rhodospirillaceae bacterium]
MARRSDHTREEQKAMAIAAGQKIIAEEGLGSFSARKVAKDIGYTVGTIYNVFGTHDELIFCINAATLDDLGQFIAERLDRTLAGPAMIKQLASLYLHFAQTHHHRWSALFEHVLPPEQPLPDWYAQKITGLFAVVEQPLGPFAGSPLKAEQTARIIWASVHGICALGLTGKLDVTGADSLQMLLDDLIDNYLTGLAHSAAT